MDRRAARGAVRVTAPAAPQIEAAAYGFDLARSLMRELGLSRPAAVSLVRRGIGDPEAARTFLEASDVRPPAELGGVEEAARRIEAAIAAGTRITVYGDFDVDGVCGTSVAVGALRGLGADCDWFIPDRLHEGYGLRIEAVEKLAARGTGLIVTVDCGITAVEEVEAAKRLGVEIIVTDHHQPSSVLPDCRIVHPGVADYECPYLCGAAVAWKLMTALGDRMGRAVAGETDLDLVALATVADLMPLKGENRSLVRQGLVVARRAGRLGMRELMRVAQCQPASLSESDFGFRLGPRINAAGRLYRADAGVELMLSSDAERAAQIAQELDRANHERRSTEQRVLGEAETALRAARTEAGGVPPAIVVSGEEWHPGVIGIVASRLVEANGRPAVVISVDGDGRARGSGRSVPGFDLLAAIGECDEWLTRYGGHRAACGLELPATDIPAFAAAFSEQALAVLGSEPVRSAQRVDAFAAGPELGLELAEELGRLAPFGIGNPAVNLLIPGAQLADARPLGQEAKHLRFTVMSGGYRARAVAFGRTSTGCDGEQRADVVVRLERNEWNGSVEPRLSVREVVPLDTEGERCDSGYRPACPDQEWWRRFEAACRPDRGTAGEGGEATGEAAARGVGESGAERREGSIAPVFTPMPHAPGTGLAALCELLSSGAQVLALCADAGRRAVLASEHGGVGRFTEGPIAICSFRDGKERFEEALAARLGLLDYRSLLDPGGGAAAEASEAYVALIDPPASPGEVSVAARLAGEGSRLLALWDEPAREFALKALDEEHRLRPAMAAIFRALRERGDVEGTALRELLEGGGTLPRGPEDAGRAVAVLTELGLAEADLAGTEHCARRLRVVSSNRTDPELSPTYRRNQALYEVKSKFLRTLRQA